MKKKVLCSILSGAFVLASLTPLYAATNDISVFINNSQVTFDTQPQIINDSTFVPMRKIFEELGASVEWNDSDKSIKATKDSKVVTLYIDKTYCEVDGKKQETGIAPQIIDSRTLVPLRMVSELLDCDVNWNGETRKIDITSKEPENKISEPLPQENVSNKENSEPEITDNREISNADYI